MKILAITNEKGGVGKSFIATQFALYCALKFNLKTCFIDLDQQANGTNVLKQNSIFRTSKINSIDLLTTTIDKSLIENEPYLIFSATDALSQLEQQGLEQHGVFAENLQKSLKVIDDKFDLAIIDTNPNPDIRQNAALITCTHLLSPIQLNKESLDGLSKLFERINLIVSKINPNLEIIGMLPNLMNTTKFQKENGQELINKFGKLLIPITQYIPEAKKRDNKVILVKDDTLNVVISVNNSYAALKNHGVIPEAQAAGLPIWEMSNAQDAWSEIKKAFFAILSKLEIQRNLKLTNEDSELIELCKKLYGNSSYKKIIKQFWAMDNTKILVGLNLENIKKLRELRKKLDIKSLEEEYFSVD